MATFNGEKFLAQQIESILAQDYSSIRLVIRDDGSTDGTIGIVKKFMQLYPEKISLFSGEGGHLGATGSFMALVRNAGAEYVMFADQDDVWLPAKVSACMREMGKCESRYGEETPLLIHTDLRVADEELSVVAESFWQYQGLAPECDSLNRMLVQNVVTGCTVMLNRGLLNLVRPAGAGMIGHDWWLGLIASAFGRIVYLPQAAILYRQHGKNTVGAVKWDISGMLGRFFTQGGNRAFVDSLRKTRQQAALFLSVYGDLLSPDAHRLVSRYASLHELNYFSRIICVLRYRFLKIGILRNVGMILTLRAM